MKNKLNKYEKIVLEVFIFNQKNHSKKDYKEKQRISKKELEERENQNLLDNEYNSYLELSPPEIFHLYGVENPSKKELDRLRISLKELEKKGLLIHRADPKFKSRTIWQLNENCKGVKELLTYPELSEDINKSREIFRFMEENRSFSKVLAKSLVIALANHSKDSEEKEKMNKILSNWDKDTLLD